ncbi:MAG: phosphomannomutase/phosphoglucomutase [Gammaproteobacteria bacterium]|nr:phosphomannomutase/phosphoglucomutase [Gammaproteobacteria bacterium]
MTLAVIQDEIFRAYDIRGIVSEGLNNDVMFWLGKAIGSEAIDKGEGCLLLGSDARLSSPDFAEHIKKGILSTGCNVVNLGQIPTPLLYYATHFLEVHSGVMITGSHNPKNYNGVKIVFKHQSLSDSQISVFKKRILAHDFHNGDGKLSQFDIKKSYLERILGDIKLNNNWKIIIDCGNAITAIAAPELFSKLGCDTTTLFADIDGTFPNHHPDPTVKDNLVDLIEKVKTENADLGIAFDGDGDRVVLISNTGKIIDADKLLMAFVKDILPENKAATVVFDVKSSHNLYALVENCQGTPLMCESGHSFVKKAMVESGALIGGEYSAHIFFKHRWYGFDDGIYSAARFIELMDKNNCSADELINSLPVSVNTPELFIAVPEQEKFTMMQTLCGNFKLDGAKINKLDGLRVSLEGGWGLIRASNTTPNLMLRFEAENEITLQKLKELFHHEIARILPQLTLPF